MVAFGTTFILHLTTSLLELYVLERVDNQNMRDGDIRAKTV